MTFTLHPDLAKSCITVGDLPHCRVVLMNNRHFPWIILVPRGENLRELFDLSEKDYHLVLQEVRETAIAFNEIMKADKINIAALGNVTPQLHIHIIARYTTDIAWPMPIWNFNPVGAEGEAQDPELPDWFYKIQAWVKAKTP